MTWLDLCLSHSHRDSCANEETYGATVDSREGEHVPTVERQSVASQITRHIRTDIEAGRLKDKQPLQSTRELAAEWKVSVNTIDSALKPLIDDGLIVTIDRKGRYVNYPITSNNLQSEEKHVIIIGGYAGSGKTELGRILSRMTNWPLLDKDSVTRPMTEAALALAGQPITDREGEIYLSKIRPAEYETLTLVMLENVECGNNAIITAPFLKEFRDPGWFERIKDATDSSFAKFTFVWVYCNPETMQQYVRHRGAARDTWKLNHWDEYVSQIDFGVRPVVPHIVIDNSHGQPALREQAANLLRSIAVLQ